MANSYAGIVILALIVCSTTVEIPFVLGKATCMALMSSFDPIKVELRLPNIGKKAQGQKFRVSLIEVLTQTQIEEVYLGQGVTYRRSYELQRNFLYQICIGYQSDRDLSNYQPFYIGYSATEDFQSMIGKVQIPQELNSQVNMKRIYEIAKQMESYSKWINSHQVKQRQLEDRISTDNIHKSKRILALGVVEVLVIVLSGVYQIFALRNFLIEKNLY